MLKRKLVGGVISFLFSMMCLSCVGLPLKDNLTSSVDLHQFVGTWKVAQTPGSLIQTVIVSQAKEGYNVQVFGKCAGKQACDWGVVSVSESYSHGIKPWDPKYPVTFLAFKEFDKKSIGLAMFNVFISQTHQPNQMIQTMLVPA
jgi:hypothetical protein